MAIFLLESVILKVLDQAMFKVISQQLRGTLTTTFGRHLSIQDFMDMDLHRCQACNKAFDLLLYVSLSFKQT